MMRLPVGALVLRALLVLLAVQFVPGVAQAEDRTTCDSVNDQCTPAQAYEAARLYAQQLIDEQGRCQPGAVASVWGPSSDPATSSTGSFAGVPTNSSGCQYLGGWRTRYWGVKCPAPTVWDGVSHACFDAQACLAKPPMGKSFASGPSPFDVVCVDGCAFESGGGVDVLLPRSDGTWLGTTTGWEPTGEACPAGAPTAEGATTSQVCEPAPDGQTFCIKPDGQHCYSLTNGSGRQICWQPGETGEKADADILQKRNVGDTPIAPQTLPPEGDTFIQAGTPITKQTTIEDRTFTTTTTNYKTASGADAKPGSPGDGEPGDGSGGDGEGEGDGTYPEGGTDGSTGASESDTAIWKTFSSDDLLGALDDSGFLVAARTCPPIPELDFGPLGVFNPNVAGWCDFVDAFGKLLLFVAAIGALTIIAR